MAVGTFKVRELDDCDGSVLRANPGIIVNANIQYREVQPGEIYLDVDLSSQLNQERLTDSSYFLGSLKRERRWLLLRKWGCPTDGARQTGQPGDRFRFTRLLDEGRNRDP